MSETPPPPPSAPQPAQPLSDSDARLYATLGSAGNILFPAIAPLIIWLIFRERSSFVDTEGKEALNWGITLVIGYIISSVLFVIVIGAVLWFVVFVLSLVFGIQAAMKNNKGEAYHYPFALRLVK
ncbi:DUF4870 domain-containing protein [Demequina sp.]|uniref:DUF4870 domain-containing protein n=1 Tax=Demequina sp. TaxID=2050685 RepID=UPI003D1251DD